VKTFQSRSFIGSAQTLNARFPGSRHATTVNPGIRNIAHPALFAPIRADVRAEQAV